MLMADTEVGAMVRQHREASLMSQQDLATAMRTRGYKWSQATVWSVESGERTLRYTESLDLAEACGFQASDKSSSEGDDRYREGVKRGIELSHEAIERMKA